MGMAKEAISEFIGSSDNFDSLSIVPGLLNQISGGLRLANQDRAAIAVGQVKQFIVHELIERHQSMYEDQLDSLADAICSIEFYIEEIAENRSNTGTALDVAEQSMNKLGYPCPMVDESIFLPDAEDGHLESCGELGIADQSVGEFENKISQPDQQGIEVDGTVDI